MALQNPAQIMQAKTAAKEFGVNLPTKITSDQLTGPTTVPNVTPTKVGTAGAGVMGAVESSQDQFTKLLEQQRKDAEASKKASQSDYTTRLFETPTPTELKADQYQEQGVNTAQKELDDINSQLQVEQHALLRETQRIQDNAVGASMGQVANMVNEAENKSLRKQADLAIVQMGLQGKFNTAKAIADRAVDASMEKEKNIIEALKVNYEDNKAMFTQAEQRQFESLLNDRNNKYQEELASKKAISDYSMEAMKMGADGATITAIRNAGTPEEAQALAAQYISPLIQQQNALDIQAKQAQIASANRANQPSAGTGWSDRANILRLAEMGDPVAIKALGYDPSTTPTKQNAQAVARDNALKELGKINGLVNNALGISSSSGTIQSPLLAQMLGLGATGASVGATGGAFVGGIGAIPGAIGGGLLGLATGAVTGADAKRKKEDFLSQVDFVLSGDSFDKFRELKQSGVTFGQTTEREWTAVQKAANELESFANRDSDGKLTGFKGSEESLRRMLTEYQTKAQQFADSFETDTVDQTTMDEINAIFGDTTGAETAFNPLSYY